MVLVVKHLALKSLVEDMEEVVLGYQMEEEDTLGIMEVVVVLVGHHLIV